MWHIVACGNMSHFMLRAVLEISVEFLFAKNEF